MKNLYIILCLLSLSAFSQNSICNGTFNYIDNGGIANNYFANSDATTTICPNAGTVITVTFSSFNVELFNDGLYVYDGDSINPDKLISSGNPSGIGIMTTAGAYWGSNLPGPFTSSSPDGCLTFRFRSDGSTEGAGWIANISCSSPQSGFILNSFLDDNNNGTRDSNEFLFPYSYFTYQKNGGASIYASSWNGTSQVNAYNVADNYSFTNNLEPYLNNSYYSISNSSYANQTIGTTPGFVTLDFPVTSNVLYNDVSVYLHRLDRPKAGANYATRLTYTNYGNQIVNTGNISFTKDSYSSTVSTSVPVTSTTTGFDYNFVNLQPFETRFIDIVQSVPNIPAVAIGQSSSNSANISIPVADTNLQNNAHTSIDYIVASYDPNDITESHGDKILFSSFNITDDLIYTIRFENTGNATADEVRIDNVLNNQIDEASVKIIAASSKCQLNRTANNLSFQFDHINLPPSVTNSQIGHGFVTYRAKLKPGFMVGTIVPNAAKIYFDTNPAIETNVFNTEFVAVLAKNTFDTANQINIYPNPVKDFLQVKSTDFINKIEVLDIQGRILLLKLNDNKIDLSGLQSGNYFVKTYFNNIVSTNKIIKE